MEKISFINQIDRLKICFFVVENKNNSDIPFLFLATYFLEEADNIRYFSLAKLINQLKDNKKELLKILYPIQKIALESAFIKDLFNSGRIFSNTELSEKEAVAFFNEIKLYEKYGIVCKIPNFKSKENKVLLDLNKEEKLLFQPSFFNLGTINYFVPNLLYNGTPISIEEAKELLVQDGLQLIKGKWVEVNHDEIKTLINLYAGFAEV